MEANSMCKDLYFSQLWNVSSTDLGIALVVIFSTKSTSSYNIAELPFLSVQLKTGRSLKWRVTERAGELHARAKFGSVSRGLSRILCISRMLCISPSFYRPSNSSLTQWWSISLNRLRNCNACLMSLSSYSVENSKKMTILRNLEKRFLKANH